MSELPVIHAMAPRSRDDLAACAHVVQANVAALATAANRRLEQSNQCIDIKTPPPGPVKRFREFLIDWRIIRDYSDIELVLRLRQVWGEFTALCWLFHHGDPHHPPHFSALPVDAPLRCTGHVHDKLTEVQRGLWRLIHERRLREDPGYRDDPAFKHERDLALSIPMKIGGRSIGSADEQTLFMQACEHAGMLAALRWALDGRLQWEGAGIMEVGATGGAPSGPACQLGGSPES